MLINFRFQPRWRKRAWIFPHAWNFGWDKVICRLFFLLCRESVLLNPMLFKDQLYFRSYRKDWTEVTLWKRKNRPELTFYKEKFPRKILNTLHGMNDRLGTVKEKISRLEDTSIETIQNVTQKAKQDKKWTEYQVNCELISNC